MYSPALIDIIDHLNHAGDLPDAAIVVEYGSRSQGCWVKLMFDSASQTCRFQAFGCGYTLAMAELVAGALERTADANIDLLQLAAPLALPAHKQSVLGFFSTLMNIVRQQL